MFKKTWQYMRAWYFLETTCNSIWLGGPDSADLIYNVRELRLDLEKQY